jgi:lysophospholipid acyltransferase
MPTLLETFSYVFYFPSAVCGPSFEFADFRDYINLQGHFKNIPKLLAIRTAFIELSKSIVNILIVVLFTKPFDVNYCITEEYANESFLWKFLYFNISFSIQKAKYYGGWKMAQSGTVLCGLGYNPIEKDNHIIQKFDRVENCVIREIEIESNPKKRMQFWNRTVHLWLKYNLFLRLLNVEKKPFKNNKGLASLITFMVSAFWHGFYPLYYVFFFLFYIIEQICSILEEDYNLFKVIENKNVVVKYLFSFFTMTFHNNLGIVFVLLDLHKAWAFTKNTYFLYPLMVFGLYFLVKNLRKNRRRKNREAGDAHKSISDNKGETPKNK